MAEDEPDLAEALGPFARHFPTDPEAKLEVTAETLPAPPKRLRTHGLAVQPGRHDYHAADRSAAAALRVESLSLWADQATLRQLGVLLLATVFHPRRVNVALGHAASHAHSLVIEPVLPPVEDPGFLRLTAAAYTYWPEDRDRHPLAAEAADAVDLPFLTLGADDSGREELELDRRRVVREESSVHGRVRLAKVLLDAGRPESPQDELHLESPRGFGGVASGSCELRLWLPGSFGWPPADA